MNTTSAQTIRASVRRRSLAYLTDSFILFGISTLIMTIIGYFAVSTATVYLIFLMLPVGLLTSAAFILRDVIFGGTSLGKRILGIRVADYATGEPASKSARALRGFSSFISFFDFLFLVFSKKSLGDRIGNTTVVYSKYVTEETLEDDGEPTVRPQKRGGGFAFLVIILSFILIVSGIVVSIAASMESIKKSEEYAVATEFIFESPYFDSLGVPEDDLILSGYNYSVDNGVTTAVFTFNVYTDEFTDTIQVVCVKSDDTWEVNEKLCGVNRNQ